MRRRFSPGRIPRYASSQPGITLPVPISTRNGSRWSYVDQKRVPSAARYPVQWVEMVSPGFGGSPVRRRDPARSCPCPRCARRHLAAARSAWRIISSVVVTDGSIPCSSRVTSAGLRESHVHDVIITKEAPNYQVGNS